LVEALSLLGEGVTANRIEAAAHSIGLAQGVLLQLDELGLGLFDLALHAELDSLKAVAQAAMPGAKKTKVVSVRFPEAAVYVIEKWPTAFVGAVEQREAGSTITPLALSLNCGADSKSLSVAPARSMTHRWLSACGLRFANPREGALCPGNRISAKQGGLAGQ